MKERISIQLASDLVEVLKQKARTQKVTLSFYLRELIKKSLSKAPLHRKESFSTVSSVDRYLLKNSIETILLIRRLFSEKDQSCLPQVTRISIETVKQILTEMKSIE